MSPHIEFGTVTRRLAAATSIIRTRRQDLARADLNGGTNGSLNHRALAAVRRLERVADRLEKAIS